MVKDFQKVVDSIYVKNGKNDILVDIYITGSNSYLLSNRISTLLTGRFVEISMLPLSFKEYLLLKEDARPNVLQGFSPYGIAIKNVSDKPDRNAIKAELNWTRIAFDDYIKFGGFPQTLEMDADTSIDNYLAGV
jgi:predicted AAA+ superfamily ATPase